ncbi:MAG: S41 family peptidase [Rubricella sp.]
MKKLMLAACAGAIAGALVTTQFVGPLVAQETQRERSTYEYLDLFGSIFERVRASYVEDVDDQELIEAAIDGMLTSLDPHSGYLPADEFSDMQIETQGEFGGLGITVTQEAGFVQVISPIDGTPAAEAGLQTNDIITHVDGASVLGLTLDEAVDLMRGPVGSEITITVVRDDEDPFDVTLVRDVIRIRAVNGRTEGDVIVLRITTFSRQTYDNLVESFDEQVAALGGIENVSGVVVDLRNNAGGLLNQAIQVSDAFLEQGEIVSTRGRDPQDSERFNATTGDLAQGLPMVVLINGGSASASEIVAGALQDHRRAVIVGEKSFGKGSVQSLIPVQGRAAIRLTTALYYTPSGRSIQALGIEPDILVRRRVGGEDVEELTRSEADLRGSLQNQSLTEDERRQLEEERARLEADAQRRNEDYQLSYALDILTGLSVLESLGD